MTKNPEAPSQKDQLPRPTKADQEKLDRIRKSINDDGNIEEELFEKELELLNAFDWSPEIYSEGELYGIRSAVGEVLLPPGFEDFKLLSNLDLQKCSPVVTRSGGKWGVLIADGIGTWLINPELDYIGYPNDVTHVCKDGKWGVLDITTGEYVIAPECEAVYDNDGFLFCNRIGFYKKDGMYGVLGDWGAHTEAIFEDVDMVPDGYVKVKYNGEWGFIGEDNKFTERDDEAYYYFEV